MVNKLTNKTKVKSKRKMKPKTQIKYVQKVQSHDIDPLYYEYMANLMCPGISNAPAFLNPHIQLPMPSVKLHNGFLISLIATEDATNDFVIAQMGIKEYTVIQFLPIISGGGTPLTGAGPAAGVLSGLSIYLTNALNDFVPHYLKNQTLASLEHAAAFSATQIYGSDMLDIGNHGLCYSAELELATLVPLANLIGHYWSGSYTLGLLQGTGNFGDGANVFPTVEDLIAISDRRDVTGDGVIRIKSHVINPSVISQKRGNSYPESENNLMETELVSFVILPRFAANVLQNNNSSLNPANLTPFSFQGTAYSNWVFYPSITSASNSLRNQAHRVTTAGQVVKKNLHSVVLKYGPERAHGRFMANLQGGAAHIFSNATAPMRIGAKVSAKGLSNIFKMIVAEPKAIANQAIGALSTVGGYRAGPQDRVVVDTHPIKFYFSWSSEIPGTGHPEVDELIAKCNLDRKEILAIVNKMKDRYMYPEREYDDPSEVVSPQNPSETMSRMTLSYVPDVYWTGTMWVNHTASDQAKGWFSKFLGLFWQKEVADPRVLENVNKLKSFSNSELSSIIR